MKSITTHVRTTRLSRDRCAMIALLLAAVVTLNATGCTNASTKTQIVYFPENSATPRVVHLKSFNALRDLVPNRPSFVDWIRGQSASPFVSVPAGIAVLNHTLYICDVDSNVVHVWDLTNGRATSLGGSGEGRLIKPVDVAVDEQGRCFVADTGRSEVVVFGRDGDTVGHWRLPADVPFQPVAVEVDGKRLLVANMASHQIEAFSVTDGRHIESFGGIGSEPGKFYFPLGVATNRSGEMLVADTMNARVQVLSSKGEPKRSFGQPGDRYGDMGKPKHLEVGPDGTVFIADAEFAHVHLFSPQGKLLMLIGGPHGGPGNTPLPRGIAVTASLPEALNALVPTDFDAKYFLFVTNSVGPRRINLFAISPAGGGG